MIQHEILCKLNAAEWLATSLNIVFGMYTQKMDVYGTQPHINTYGNCHHCYMFKPLWTELIFPGE